MPYPSLNNKYNAKAYSSCPSNCVDNQIFDNKLKANNLTGYIEGVAAYQKEILANGPIQVGFTVFKDFFSYNGGVYTPTTTEKAGGHAVEIVGWGTENSQG